MLVRSSCAAIELKIQNTKRSCSFGRHWTCDAMRTYPSTRRIVWTYAVSAFVDSPRSAHFSLCECRLAVNRPGSTANRTASTAIGGWCRDDRRPDFCYSFAWCWCGRHSSATRMCCPPEWDAKGCFSTSDESMENVVTEYLLWPSRVGRPPRWQSDASPGPARGWWPGIWPANWIHLCLFVQHRTSAFCPWWMFAMYSVRVRADEWELCVDFECGSIVVFMRCQHAHGPVNCQTIDIPIQSICIHVRECALVWVLLVRSVWGVRWMRSMTRRVVFKYARIWIWYWYSTLF